MTELMIALQNEKSPSVIFDVIRERQQQLSQKLDFSSREFTKAFIAQLSRDELEDFAMIRFFHETVSRSWQFLPSNEANRSSAIDQLMKARIGDCSTERFAQLLAYKAVGQLPGDIAIAA
ncbi:hypothetical protein J2Y63_004189 [Shinella sp. BE166]|uniref:hypothetical protein n=1 Tax=Shinella sp. BE166 TaxID=3373918 RepID=UPI003EB9A24E